MSPHLRNRKQWYSFPPVQSEGQGDLKRIANHQKQLYLQASTCKTTVDRGVFHQTLELDDVCGSEPDVLQGQAHVGRRPGDDECLCLFWLIKNDVSAGFKLSPLWESRFPKWCLL
ncbi:hypothetical protein CEXT_715681 [Caerostris extrusa]|uniref:Uncharacterized protein n=1 Tax=Caerostris extrusa TaxID=172846 RepID=A0AAV4MLT6_CAEEX|nr:hypothetical protein CEXT_715681 [Caerostris extrusa]